MMRQSSGPLIVQKTRNIPHNKIQYGIIFMLKRLLISIKKKQLRQHYKKNVKHLVFYHIPRTGGSSVWHALAANAVLQQIKVVDLYHESKIYFSDSSKTLDAISDRQRLLRKQTCLIHHHTEIKIQNYFDNPPLYATIVRDPFDRFISDIKHLSAYMRSQNFSKAKVVEELGLMRDMANPSIDIHSLIDIYSRSDYFQNYYRNWFGKLLLGRNGLGGNEVIKDVYDPRFPAYVRRAFKNISCFTDLNKSLRAIAHSFEIPLNHSQLGHLNKTPKKQTFEIIHSRYALRFEKDYSFLKDLGFHYKRRC